MAYWSKYLNLRLVSNLKIKLKLSSLLFFLLSFVDFVKFRNIKDKFTQDGHMTTYLKRIFA